MSNAWEKTIQNAPSDSWEKTAADEPQGISKLESLLRGSGQGLSLGFSDELTGAGESALGSLGLVPDKTYEQARDEARTANAAAQQANPGTYLTGEIGGGIATSFVPGMAVLNAGKGIAGAAALGAAAGGLSSLGQSEAGVTDAALYEDALKGAAVGGVLGGGVGALGKAAGALKETPLGKVAGAARKGQLGDDVAKTMANDIKSGITNIADEAATNVKVAGTNLGKTKAALKPENIRPTQEALEGIAKTLSTDMNAAKYRGVVEDITNMSANLDNMSARDIDKQLNFIQAQFEGAGLQGGDLKEAMSTITDAITKNNPQYAQTLSEAKKAFIPAAQADDAFKGVGGVDAGSYSSDQNKKLEVIRNLFEDLKTSTKNPVNRASSKLDDLGQVTNKADEINALRSQADDLVFNREVADATDPRNMKTLASIGKGIMYGGAKMVGEGANKFDSSRIVTTASNLANKLGNTALGKKLSDTLAMEPTMRDRGLFVLSQQPWFRELTKDDKK